MQTSISRTQFLRGDLTGRSVPIRPPWALAEALFVEKCTRCDKCREACIDGLIVNGQGGFPQMDFTRGGCDFCSDCVAVCEPEALYRPTKEAEPWSLGATILKSCLSLNGVTCRSCGDVCDARAITFSLQVGGRAKPMIDPVRCTGCGACLSVCPAKAVEISNNSTRDETA
ncbi:MAG: ferredoxin-type protein NapF [Sedimenticola sp.]